MTFMRSVVVSVSTVLCEKWFGGGSKTGGVRAQIRKLRVRFVPRVANFQALTRYR